MWKDQGMLQDLLLALIGIGIWSAIIIRGHLVAVRYNSIMIWNNGWREWRRQRQIQQQIAEQEKEIRERYKQARLLIERERKEEASKLAEVRRKMCVICNKSVRRSVFAPCWHLACCPECALSIEQQSPPKCPLCHQDIICSVTIKDSMEVKNLLIGTTS
ncbi:E3 ubiquitin-protein ligase SPL2-like [Rutidosis leptorrhynchoides]|uniref:E3 ubiquitin-protein ligase SPL2-like n=1 Tax=Rutidosis leptorrhynchoides TaxID=125765 RepID=UPI003A99EB4F